jgi:putative ABC transport system permease protein
MTLLRLAYRSVQVNRRTYFGFLASSAFAVVVFYLFAAFRALPQVVEGRYKGAEGIAVGFQVCQYLIVAFSVFFTLYSNSAFVKSRKRELGIIALLGAERRQLTLLLFGESMIVGTTALVAGLALGTLFSRLFVMAIDRILASPEPLQFAVQARPVLATVVTYLTIFAIISALNTVSIHVDQVIQLVKAPSKPKTPPRYSRLAIAVGAACLVAGYAVAWTVKDVGVLLAFVPVTLVVSVGTHLLFTQGSVAVLRGLQRRRAVYYKNTNLLTISDLVFKMKDNSRILAQVAILSAVVLTASGVVYTLGVMPMENVSSNHPRALSLLLPLGGDSERIADDFGRRLSSGGANVTDTATMPAVQLLIPEVSDQPGIMVSEGDYNRWAREMGKPQVRLDRGHVVRTLINPSAGLGIGETGDSIAARAGEVDLTFVLDGGVSTTLIGGYDIARFTLVCDDDQFAELVRDLPAEQLKLWFSCEISNWSKTQAARAVQNALEAIPDQDGVAYTSRVLRYVQLRGQVHMTMMIAMFIAFLFFLAAGSMLYFRFFLEIQEDQARYVALRRIGLSWKEIRAVVTREMAVLFFAPWAVAFVHQMFALRSYSKVTPMMPLEVWKYGAAAAGIFLALQTVYFLLARAAYLEEVGAAVR